MAFLDAIIPHSYTVFVEELNSGTLEPGDPGYEDYMESVQNQPAQAVTFGVNYPQYMTRGVIIKAAPDVTHVHVNQVIYYSAKDLKICKYKGETFYSLHCCNIMGEEEVVGWYAWQSNEDVPTTIFTNTLTPVANSTTPYTTENNADFTTLSGNISAYDAASTPKNITFDDIKYYRADSLDIFIPA